MASAALFSAPLTLVNPGRNGAAVPPERRTKIWELSRHLHCSIIGTCLSTGELRHILEKANLKTLGSNDHELHGQAVLLAGQHDSAAKLLHKALDKRHKPTITQFAQAKTEDEVRTCWRDAVKRGEIPGAYWATLTHASTTDGLVREVFGEVHMLSHLVGAANRADIRRLSALEAENLELKGTLRRQQEQLRGGFSARDSKIRNLGALLAKRIAEAKDGVRAKADDASELVTLSGLVADLERKVASESRRRTSIEARTARLADQLRQEQSRSEAAEIREMALAEELQALEANLIGSSGDGAQKHVIRLDGRCLLYVGGRANQVSHIRDVGEQTGATVLHHDGGMEERNGLLAGLVSRADVVMFPVDCVSHEAVAAVKRLCRHIGKPFVPLRTSGVSSFVAALARLEASQEQRTETRHP